jgi:uncharacterized protein YndB with AHSA1/START domain
MTAEVSEQILIDAPLERVYDAVADVRRIPRWSPECFAVWVLRRSGGQVRSFVGWNRRGARLWFTTCRVRVAFPAEEFAFDVTTFGLPVSRWTYRLAPADTGTRVTESWVDRRGRTARRLGRVFTGPVARSRPQANREGMRATLRRLKADLEGH